MEVVKVPYKFFKKKDYVGVCIPGSNTSVVLEPLGFLVREFIIALKAA